MGVEGGGGGGWLLRNKVCEVILQLKAGILIRFMGLSK